ncbi:hypothetical protein FGO68_gene2909 [Halteria grandinella]|uniref:Uncharacterized protein n=1 Tax=Halteria grandinella TaxID=5974 RepID=A0A8J8NCM8_HALGN|nr:hypothetical protein FGO68_gene2909 [Halteria grandinella]
MNTRGNQIEKKSNNSSEKYDCVECQSYLGDAIIFKSDSKYSGFANIEIAYVMMTIEDNYHLNCRCSLWREKRTIRLKLFTKNFKASLSATLSLQQRLILYFQVSYNLYFIFQISSTSL